MDGVSRWCSGAGDNGSRKMGLFKERHDKTSDMNGHCAVARERRRKATGGYQIKSHYYQILEVGISWNNGNCKSKSRSALWNYKEQERERDGAQILGRYYTSGCSVKHETRSRKG